MNPAIANQVRGIAAEIFDVPAARITTESGPENVEGWDSLKHLNLMLALEEQFGIKFDPEDFEHMGNISQIVALVERKR